MNNTVFTRVIFALFCQFSRQKTEVRKLCEEFLEGVVFRGDLWVRSGIRYPIHKLETKRFSFI